MAKKALSNYVTESVDLSPYMDLDEDLGWICNARGINVLLRSCKNYSSLGFKYVDTAIDEENPCLFLMKFEKVKI